MPRVSIVICTDARAQSLRTTLVSLQQLQFRDFEVCVVCGPTPDGTRELVASWPRTLKTAHNDSRNLSISRNLGIQLAAGEIVAFLDDDAIPEPEWLDPIVAAYDDEKVGGAGGFVLDHTGMRYQWRFGTIDRLGRPDLTWNRPAPEFNFPYSSNLPHLLGANSTFRRSALVEIGGFDEEFDYFLDETDLAARLIDAGWHITQIDGAVVHHRYLPSNIRNASHTIRSWYSVFKNKLYFGLINRRGRYSVAEVVDEFNAFVDRFRADCEQAVATHRLTAADRKRFEKEAQQAREDGLARGMSDDRTTIRPDQFKLPPPPFAPYLPPENPALSHTFCLLSREYPPDLVGGVGRYVHQLAKGLVALGHQVHVLTITADQSRVDFNEGVWIHRLAATEAAIPPPETGSGPVPQDIWNQCAARLDYLLLLARRKPISCVYSPIWDCEGAAILEHGAFPIVVGLQTSLAFWLDTHPGFAGNANFMGSFARPMLALERRMLTGSTALHAISHSILSEIETRYDLDLAAKTGVVWLALDDRSHAPNASAPPLPGNLRVLFVGRLEARKGIDVLLDVIPDLLTRFPEVHFDIVGNDSLASESGQTYRELFEARQLRPGDASRVAFHGEVSEDALLGFYAACDIFVAPSRFESFGLIFVEAMMFGKPVIGCRAGGMIEVIGDDGAGLLAEPGDADSLSAALSALIGDKDRRIAMGLAARRRYEAEFVPSEMARRIADIMLAAAEGRPQQHPTTASVEAALSVAS